MANKELAILLTAKNNASGPVRAVSRDVGTLNRVAGRAGQGVRTLGSNLKNLALGAGAVAAVGLGAAIKSGLDSLAERESVISATEAAIKATGGAARVSAADIRTWSEALEAATGAAVDDKAIQDAANTLLRFTTITEDNFQRTLTAATDLGAAMKTGPQQAAKLLGKALADPVKGMTQLRRAGVVLTAAEEKRIKALVKANRLTDAQATLLRAVEQRYKGAGAASAGPYQRALNLLADAAEDAKMALAEGFLPVIERAATWLNKKLADPKVIEDIRSAGRSIAGLFDRAIDFGERIPWESVRAAMVAAGQGAKAAYSLFTSLPPWVQTAVLTGWGLNKLTGGALSGIVGELGKGLIRGVLGMNAGVVNINAGVVNGGGGVPGVGGGGRGVTGFGGRLGILNNPLLRMAGLLGGGMLLAGSNAGTQGVGGLGGNVLGGAMAGAGLGGPIGAIAGALTGAVKSVAEQQSAGTANMAANIRDGLNSSIAGKTMPELRTALTAVDQGIAEIRSNPLTTVLHGDALAQLEGMRGDLQRQIGKEAEAALIAQRAGEKSTAAGDKVAAEMRAAKAAQQAAASRASSENAGIRAAIAAQTAALRSINFSPRIVVPITVPAPRVAISLTERGRIRYYQYGNGGPVHSRVDL